MLHHQTYGGDLLVASGLKKGGLSLVLHFPASKAHSYLPCAGLQWKHRGLILL